MAGTFELKRAGARYFFTLLDSAGNVMLISQMYASKAAALDGTAIARSRAADRANFQLFESRANAIARGKTDSGDRTLELVGSRRMALYFTLNASAGLAVGNSQIYDAEDARAAAIAACMSDAPAAAVEDCTGE